MRIDHTLTDRRVGGSAATRYRELVAARLVMSPADLRLRKRASERSRRHERRSH